MHQPTQAFAGATERFGGPQTRPENPRSDSMQTDKTTFFLDDGMLDLDIEVDPFELPPFEQANVLFRSFSENCHNLFPLLAKKAFIDHFNDCTCIWISSVNYFTNPKLARNCYRNEVCEARVLISLFNRLCCSGKRSIISTLKRMANTIELGFRNSISVSPIQLQRWRRERARTSYVPLKSIGPE